MKVLGDSMEDLELPPDVGEDFFTRIKDHVAKLIVSLSTMHAVQS